MSADAMDIDHADTPPVRSATRAPTRRGGARARSLPRGEVLGRNGEVLTRKVGAGSSDPFHIPDDLKEPGWTYQWLSERIYNNPDIVRRHNHEMYQAGWRPVHAKGKWNGVYGPPGDTGHILVGDSGLYERPQQLTEEAKEDELRKAVGQMRDRDAALMGGAANLRGNTGNGIEMGGRYRKTGGDIRMSIDPALDVERPSHPLADDEVA